MDITTTIYLIAGIVGTTIILLGWEISGRMAYLLSRSARRLHEVESLEHLDGSAHVPIGSLAYRLIEAQVKLTPTQFGLLSMSLGVFGVLFSWIFFIPGFPALAIGGILAYLPLGYLQEKARGWGRMIDEKLAIALSRITPGLQVNRGLDDVLEEVARSLDSEGPNPLSPELLLTVNEMRTRNVEQALRDLAKRSSSLSLSNVAMLLESYHRAGGGQYAKVFGDSATSIQRIITVRTHAQAKAAQPLQSARLIPAMLGLVLLVMMSDPVTHASFSEPLVQVIMTLAIGAMGIGYLIMRNEVLKSV